MSWIRDGSCRGRGLGRLGRYEGFLAFAPAFMCVRPSAESARPPQTSSTPAPGRRSRTPTRFAILTCARRMPGAPQKGRSRQSSELRTDLGPGTAKNGRKGTLSLKLLGHLADLAIGPETRIAYDGPICAGPPGACEVRASDHQNDRASRCSSDRIRLERAGPQPRAESAPQGPAPAFVLLIS